MIVWAATGIWHGASWNFLFWGLYYGVLLVLEKMVWGKALARLPAALQHIYTLFLVVIGWALFAIEDMGQLGQYLKCMFGFGGLPAVSAATLYYLRSYGTTSAVRSTYPATTPEHIYHSPVLRCLNHGKHVTVLPQKKQHQDYR